MRSGWGWRRVGTIASTTALIIAIALAALMIVPSLLGFQRYVIMTGSMEPDIPTGSIVYDEVVPVEDLEVGDVITFVPPPEYNISDPVTHRIVSIEQQPDADGQPGPLVFQTKGDANEHPDAWEMILDGEDQARVKYQVPYLGYFYLFLSRRWVQLLLIGLPALGIAIFVGISMWRVSGAAVIEQRQEAAEAAAAEASRADEQVSS